MTEQKEGRQWQRKLLIVTVLDADEEELVLFEGEIEKALADPDYRIVTNCHFDLQEIGVVCRGEVPFGFVIADGDTKQVDEFREKYDEALEKNKEFIVLPFHVEAIYGVGGMS